MSSRSNSKRDRALAADADKKFPLDDNDGGIRFTNQENWGHDLFYGIESGLNKKRDVFGDGTPSYRMPIVVPVTMANRI